MKPLMLVVLGFFFSASAALAADDVQLRECPEDIRQSYVAEAERDVGWFAEAYGLSDSEVAEFRKLAEQRVEEEIKMWPAIVAATNELALAAERIQAERGEDANISAEEYAKISAPLNELLAKRPIDLKNLQRDLEAKLSPERAVAGREKLDDVRTRSEEQARKLAEAASMNEAALRTVVAMQSEEHRKADAQLSPAGNPMPKQEFVAPTLPAPQIQKPLVAPPPVEKPRPAPRLEPPPPRVEAPATPPQVALPAPRLAPAPPVDEWDRHVDSVAQKYKFTAEQKGRAQAILKDLRDRARQYRKSHTGDYERLKRMSDQTERSAEEKRLNEPLDELFAELKERLEVLPTLEQREAAGGSKNP